MSTPATTTTPSASTSTKGTHAQPEFRVEPDAPVFVASAVLGSALLGSTAGALLGVSRRQSPIHLATWTGLSCGIAGLAFFGMREYLVSPVLVGMQVTQGHAVRYAQMHGEKVTPTVGQVRTNRVLDSAVAGGLAGGMLSFGMRGPRTALPAAFTSALLATLGQFAVNEVRAQRLQLLARKAKAANPTAEHPGSSELMPDLPSVSDALGDIAKPEGAKRGDSPLTQRLLAHLTHVLPIKKITDDEYLATMEKRKRDIRKRLKEIDAEQLALFERSTDHEGVHEGEHERQV